MSTEQGLSVRGSPGQSSEEEDLFEEEGQYLLCMSIVCVGHTL